MGGGTYTSDSFASSTSTKAASGYSLDDISYTADIRSGNVEDQPRASVFNGELLTTAEPYIVTAGNDVSDVVKAQLGCEPWIISYGPTASAKEYCGVARDFAGVR